MRSHPNVTCSHNKYKIHRAKSVRFLKKPIVSIIALFFSEIAFSQTIVSDPYLFIQNKQEPSSIYIESGLLNQYAQPNDSKIFMSLVITGNEVELESKDNKLTISTTATEDLSDTRTEGMRVFGIEGSDAAKLTINADLDIKLNNSFNQVIGF